MIFRTVNGYDFKLLDEDEWGYLVEVYKDGVLLATEWTSCSGANCEPTDEELMELVP